MADYEVHDLTSPVKVEVDEAASSKNIERKSLDEMNEHVSVVGHGFVANANAPGWRGPWDCSRQN